MSDPNHIMPIRLTPKGPTDMGRLGRARPVGTTRSNRNFRQVLDKADLEHEHLEEEELISAIEEIDSSSGDEKEASSVFDLAKSTNKKNKPLRSDKDIPVEEKSQNSNSDTSPLATRKSGLLQPTPSKLTPDAPHSILGTPNHPLSPQSTQDSQHDYAKNDPNMRPRKQVSAEPLLGETIQDNSNIMPGKSPFPKLTQPHTPQRDSIQDSPNPMHGKSPSPKLTQPHAPQNTPQRDPIQDSPNPMHGKSPSPKLTQPHAPQNTPQRDPIQDSPSPMPGKSPSPKLTQPHAPQNTPQRDPIQDSPSPMPGKSPSPKLTQPHAPQNTPQRDPIQNSPNPMHGKSPSPKLTQPHAPQNTPQRDPIQNSPIPMPGKSPSPKLTQPHAPQNTPQRDPIQNSPSPMPGKSPSPKLTQPHAPQNTPQRDPIQNSPSPMPGKSPSPKLTQPHAPQNTPQRDPIQNSPSPMPGKSPSPKLTQPHAPQNTPQRDPIQNSPSPMPGKSPSPKLTQPHAPQNTPQRDPIQNSPSPMPGKSPSPKLTQPHAPQNTPQRDPIQNSPSPMPGKSPSPKLTQPDSLQKDFVYNGPTMKPDSSPKLAKPDISQKDSVQAPSSMMPGTPPSPRSAQPDSLQKDFVHNDPTIKPDSSPKLAKPDTSQKDSVQAPSSMMPGTPPSPRSAQSDSLQKDFVHNDPTIKPDSSPKLAKPAHSQEDPVQNDPNIITPDFPLRTARRPDMQQEENSQNGLNIKPQEVSLTSGNTQEDRLQNDSPKEILKNPSGDVWLDQKNQGANQDQLSLSEELVEKPFPLPKTEDLKMTQTTIPEEKSEPIITQPSEGKGMMQQGSPKQMQEESIKFDNKSRRIQQTIFSKEGIAPANQVKLDPESLSPDHDKLILTSKESAESKFKKMTHVDQEGEASDKNFAEFQFASQSVSKDSISENTPSYSTTIQDIIDQIVKNIETIQTAGKTETIVTLKHPPILEGANLVLTNFDKEKKEFNIAFTHLSEDGKEFLDRHLRQDSLTDALENKGFVIHTLTTTTLAEVPYSQPEQRPTRDSDERPKQQQQESQDGESEKDEN